jgi:hypothetical protein
MISLWVVAALAGPCGERAAPVCADEGVTRILAGDPSGMLLVEEACAQTDAYACYRLASTLLDAPGVTADPARAASLLERACDAGQPDACADYGQLLSRGHGVPTNAPEARVRLEQACTLGAVRACGLLAEMLVAGFGGPADPVLALAHALRACEGTLYGPSCAQAAGLLTSGTAVPVDRPRAQALHIRGCIAGYGPSCTVSASDARERRQYTDAHDLAGRGCTADEAGSCLMLGIMHLKGEGVGPDTDAALSRLVRACELGHAGACQIAGALLAQGEGIPADAARAEVLLTKACALDPARCP